MMSLFPLHFFQTFSHLRQRGGNKGFSFFEKGPNENQEGGGEGLHLPDVNRLSEFELQ